MTDMENCDINDKVENILHLTERMMELHCEMHYEKLYCNYKTVSRLKQEQYDPLKKELKSQLESLFGSLSRPTI